MRLLGLAAGHDVVAGHDQPPAPQRDADSRAGRVPGPVRPLHVPGNLDRRAPGCAVVVTSGDPDRARSLARSIEDGRFGIVAKIV